MEVELPNLSILDGDFEDIRLEDASLDAMIVVDIQDVVNLKTCCKEFKRVLKPEAIMCACAPFMGLGGSDDPLDVGEFMKNTESTLNSRPYVDKASIKIALTETFDYCDMGKHESTHSLRGRTKTFQRGSETRSGYAPDNDTAPPILG